MTESLALAEHPIVEQIVAQSARPLESASTMPAASYYDPSYYSQEMRRVISRDWLGVGRLEQVPSAGDFLTLDIAGEPIVVVRGDDGQVRVFSRVCRHRYADVLADIYGDTPACGTIENFTCPYHLWTYRLDGSLITAFDFARRTEFEPARFGLRPIRSEIWQGFIFVNLDDDTTRPLDMSSLKDALGSYDLTDWTIAAVGDWGEQAASWKVAVENALEFYHHIGAHRGTVESIMPGLGTICYDGSQGVDTYWSRTPISVESAAVEIDGHLQPTFFGEPNPEIPPAERSVATILVRLPLFMVALGADFCMWLKILPTGPETHTFVFYILAPPNVDSARALAAAAEFKTFMDGVQAEDVGINSRVQALMHSDRAREGVLHDLEIPLLVFQRYLAQMFQQSYDRVGTLAHA